MKTSKPTHFSHGFTLIELLVVVSIIGMLSSVILVALQSARQKGNVGAGLKFSSYNYHALGADALVMWNFDEGPSVADAKDLSSSNISGVLSAGVSKSNLQTPANSGYSALFSTAGTSYIRGNFSGLSSSAIDLSGGFTVSLWVRPDGNGGSGALVDTYDVSDPTGSRPFGIRITPNIVILCNNTSWTQTGYTTVNNIWQHLAISYKSPSSYSLYVNGKLTTTLSPCTVPGALSMKHFNVATENYSVPGSAFRGNIDEIAVYKQSLSASDIEQIYALSAAKHGIALGK